MRHVIRAFQADDIGPAVRMWERSEGVLLDRSDQPERLLAFLNANRGLSFVASDPENRLLGSILCSHDTRRGYIYHLAVAQDARRSGVGGGLLRAALKALADQRIDKCHIHVLKKNAPALEFWEAAGWSRRDDILTFSAPTRA